MTIERTCPDPALGERAMLEGWLDYHRATLVAKCDGLTDDELRIRSVPPSTMSLLGLVRHMTDVERFWFREVLDHEPVLARYWDNPGHDDDFDRVDTAVVADDFTAFAEERSIARDRAAAHGLDDVAANPAEPVTLRWILTHMIEEYARHNGHADLLRECVDGTTGE